jgi:hypothetical protein
MANLIALGKVMHKSIILRYIGWWKSLSAPDDYSKKNMHKYFQQFQSLTMIT